MTDNRAQTRHPKQQNEPRRPCTVYRSSCHQQHFTIIAVVVVLLLLLLLVLFLLRVLLLLLVVIIVIVIKYVIYISSVSQRI